jgi:hypothetical protein
MMFGIIISVTEAPVTIDDALLIRLYHDQPLATDMLPYTKEMEAILAGYNRQHRKRPQTCLSLYRELIKLRKNGKLITREPVVAEIEPEQGRLF